MALFISACNIIKLFSSEKCAQLLELLRLFRRHWQRRASQVPGADDKLANELCTQRSAYMLEWGGTQTLALLSLPISPLSTVDRVVKIHISSRHAYASQCQLRVANTVAVPGNVKSSRGFNKTCRPDLGKGFIVF